MDRPEQAATDRGTAARPANAIASIADFIGDPVDAAAVPARILRFRNDRAAATLGLDRLGDAQWIAHFGEFVPIAGSLARPLALRYHGHQFRVYNPDIGDGRGFLFAQLIEAGPRGRLLDLGTKGSGQTPYSRFGDGRLTLKGAVREILATEMLEALGVPTSRTFSVVETGEQLQRNDEPSPTRGAVLVRLSHGHIRIGSFQRLAALGQREELARLTAYCLTHLYRDTPAADPALQLFTLVAASTADLAASYMVAGFVHGVLNSDNIAITGESFDYGPWRFTSHWEDGFTAAYFDHAGLYAFGRQAEAIHWNLAQLAMALVGGEDHPGIVAVFGDWPELFQNRFAARFLWRLGLVTDDPALARRLSDAAVTAMRAGAVPIDRFFFDWRGGRGGVDPAYADPQWGEVRSLVARCTPAPGALDHAYWDGAGPQSMHIDEVEAIWAAIAERDDWAPLHAKVAAARALGAALGSPQV